MLNLACTMQQFGEGLALAGGLRQRKLHQEGGGLI